MLFKESIIPKTLFGREVFNLTFMIYIDFPFSIYIDEGLDGGSAIHYSSKNLPIIHLIKILGYSLK